MENNLPSVEDAIHSYKKFYFFEAFTDNELYHLKKLMQEYASLLVGEKNKDYFRVCEVNTEQRLRIAELQPQLAQRDKEIEGLKEDIKKLKFMIDNNLHWDDMKNDNT